MGSSQPRHSSHVSCIDRWIFYHWATREALLFLFLWLFWILVAACRIFSWGIQDSVVTACGTLSCGMGALSCSRRHLVSSQGMEPRPSELGTLNLSREVFTPWFRHQSQVQVVTLASDQLSVNWDQFLWPSPEIWSFSRAAHRSQENFICYCWFITKWYLKEHNWTAR